MDFLGDVIDDKYEILRVTGEGGMGTVYEARHRELQRRVAIKFLHLHLVASDAAVARFRREARLAASLRHDHIVDVTDLGVTEQGVPYIVMELLRGQDLQRELRAGRLAPARAAHILTQALAAVAAAHAEGIIHRDLKPENIFLCSDRHFVDWVKLLDFGIAKLSSGHAQELTTLTASGHTLGTPHYMSPEQAAGASEVSAASDIYSLGVVLYQMLTGALPFSAANYNALMIEILRGVRPSRAVFDADVPAEMIEAIEIAMAQDPARRFESARDFELRLRPFAAAPPPGSAEAHAAEVATAPPHPLTTPAGAVRARPSANAIFLGLSLDVPRITTSDGEPLQVLYLSEVSELHAALQYAEPRLIVTTNPLDFEAIAERFPVFRASVVEVRVGQSGQELVIREWNAEHAAFVVSREGLASFDEQLARLCTLPRPLCIRRDALVGIGEDDGVELGERRFRVHTEVTAGPKVAIVTTVWLDGAIVTRRSQSFELSSEHVLSELRQAVAAQHAAVRDSVTSDHEC